MGTRMRGGGAVTVCGWVPSRPVCTRCRALTSGLPQAQPGRRGEPPGRLCGPDLRVPPWRFRIHRPRPARPSSIIVISCHPTRLAALHHACQTTSAHPPRHAARRPRRHRPAGARRPHRRDRPGPAGASRRVEMIDAQGWLLSPPFVDAHFHLDATLSHGLPRVNASGTLLEGIALWGELKPQLTEEAVAERALQYCDWAVARGLLAIRSHVDVCDDRLLAVRALLDVQAPRRALPRPAARGLPAGRPAALARRVRQPAARARPGCRRRRRHSAFRAHL